MTITYVILGILMILCIFMMRKITILEDDNFELGERLKLSDEEYISLFDVNMALSEQVEDFETLKKSEIWYDEEREKRMNIIGQNGNDGEHYKN